MKNRTIIGIICIVASIAIMFGIFPLINKAAARKVEIVQVNKRIESGQQITDEDITKVTVGGYGLSNKVIRDEKEVIGKYAASDIYPNANIVNEMLSIKIDNANDILKTLNGQQRAISISIPNLANGLSGKLKNGDIVSVIVVKDNSSTIPGELTYVKVITTTTSQGLDNDELISNSDGTHDLPTTVTLLVNPEQARLLALYEQSAKMHLSLVYRGNEDIANQYLQAQQQVFDNGGESNE